MFQTPTATAIQSKSLVEIVLHCLELTKLRIKKRKQRRRRRGPGNKINSKSYLASLLIPKDEVNPVMQIF
jgi:hypothetical protein